MGNFTTAGTTTSRARAVSGILITAIITFSICEVAGCLTDSSLLANVHSGTTIPITTAIEVARCTAVGACSGECRPHSMLVVVEVL
eukprot:2982388-Rhodomonas_salina.2